MEQTISINNAAKDSWAEKMADSILINYPKSEWKWHYEHGLVVNAISQVEGERFQTLAYQWADHFVDAEGKICTYRKEEFNLDQVCPGRLLLSVYQKTGEERYAKAMQLLKQQLKEQPRTSEGGLWHKLIYPHQMWLDGIYMADVFNAGYIATFLHGEGFEEVTRQFKLIDQHARDPQTGLLYHGWDESKSQKWADPATGCSPHFWGRAMGWYVMALVDVLEILSPSHEDYERMLQILRRTAEALVRYQDGISGLWYQVVNLAGKTGNYLESSVSAMLAYGFAKAVRNGWLPSDYSSSARRAYHGLLEHMIRLDAQGNITLENTCKVAGLGGEPYRDGSYEYYVNEPVGSNDFKGAGPFILASLEIAKEAKQAE